MYRQDSVIDLTLTIADLLVEGTGRWKVNLVRQTFTDEDAELILKLKPHRSRKDSFKWGYTANGCYSSQSGARNKVAEEIAVSVTRDHRCQSYVASGGPRWLLNRLESEARRACT
ncbi:hypothetical protein DY000_02049211 [Brassica cretica]|uniref:Uncharacterized protein n=1 Tax=Brassica cretica TaxID=69181 RepID=A0ABQ7EYY9_BRACR|nr:hypothetical protein DY000_02049211 [Brassica cretica]